MKKWLYLLLSLASLFATAHAAQMDNQCQFLEEGGDLGDDGFLEFDNFEVFTGSCEEGLFLAQHKPSAKYAFLDQHGHLMIDLSDALMVKPFRHGVAIVKTYDGTGLINAQGAWVLEPNYDDIDHLRGFDVFSSHRAVATRYQDGQIYSALIDTTGKEIIPLTQGLLTPIFNHKPIYTLTVFDASDNNQLQMGIYDGDGRVLIPVKNQLITTDDNGEIAKICRDDQGCILLDQNFHFITDWMAESGDSTVRYGDGLIAIKQHDKYGYIDTHGRSIIESVYDDAQAFVQGVAVVRSGDAWYLIDKHNQPISQSYDGLIRYDERLYIAEKLGKYGIIDRDGKVVQPLSYDEIKAYITGDGLLAVKQHGLWGFMNRDAKMVIKPQYQAVNYFADGLAAAKKNHKWGFINSNNQTVIDFIYDEPLKDMSLLEFSQAYAVTDGVIAVVKDGKWGIIDTQGVAKTDFIYDEIGLIDKHFIMVIKDGQTSHITRKGW